MIKMIRLDERLIHGQIAIKWSRHLGVDRIVVVSNEAADSTLMQQSLLMAAPPTAKVAIKGRSDAIALLSDSRADRLAILVITATLENLKALIEALPSTQLINIGNYGRTAPKVGGTARTAYGPNLYLCPDERDVLLDVASKGVPTVMQTTPEDNPTSITRLLKD